MSHLRLGNGMIINECGHKSYCLAFFKSYVQFVIKAGYGVTPQ